jgi:hypothetical protein
MPIEHGYVLYAPLEEDDEAVVRCRVHDPETGVIAFERVAAGAIMDHDLIDAVYDRLIAKLVGITWGVSIYGAAMLRSLLS